jgi:hypothetical protein
VCVQAEETRGRGKYNRYGFNRLFEEEEEGMRRRRIKPLEI